MMAHIGTVYISSDAEQWRPPDKQERAILERKPFLWGGKYGSLCGEEDNGAVNITYKI